MHVSAATILAIYVAASSALPPPRLCRLPPIDESISGCKDVGFIDVWPPSPAELRCRGFDVGDENPKKDHVQIEKRKLPDINRSLPGCKDLKASFPPSQKELYCRGLADKNGKKLSKGSKRDASPEKSWWREYAESMIDHSIPGCTDVAWLAVMPKSAAQIRCEKLIAEQREKKQKKKHVEVEKRGLPAINRSLPGCKKLKAGFPPSPQELYCRGLVDAKGKKISKSNGKRDALPPYTPWGVYEDMISNHNLHTTGCIDPFSKSKLPPSEERCREIAELAKPKKMREEGPAKGKAVLHNSKRDALPAEIEKRIPKTSRTPRGCEGMAFLDVWPPSKAELRCKGWLNDEGDADWLKILGQDVDETPKRTHVKIDKRVP